jgi:hypothetical protein
MAGLITAIDPGSTMSAWVVIDEDLRPIAREKAPNKFLLQQLRTNRRILNTAIAIEMIASYGMPVGAEVFDTCVWIGRFQEAAGNASGYEPVLVKRGDVKRHHCHSNRAKDSNVRQALVDRFAPGESNYGKGTKASPGWFYGFRADLWQAYALAVYLADTNPV